MAEISTQLVKELREKTGAGIVDCKKALVESGGDFEKAVDVLRKTGAAKAEKKSGRITAEGRIVILSQGADTVIAEINSETDFVAKNPEFKAFTDGVAALILSTDPKDIATLLSAPYQGKKLQDVLQDLILKIGENISIRRFQKIHAGSDEKIGSYIHMGDKIGVLIRLKGPAGTLNDSLLRDVAMHIAAASPQYLSKEQIPASVIEHEKEIYREQMKDLNKPAPVLEKILEGKVLRFADEVCLLNQIFVKDPTGKQTIDQYLKQVNPEIQTLEFIRYQVGEGIARKESDFAAEVAKQLNS